MIQSRDTDLKIRVLTESMKGKTYRQIQSTTGASFDTISSLLHEITEEARMNIERHLFINILPIETHKRLLKFDYIDQLLFELMDNSKDERVRLQAAAQLLSVDERRFSVLTSDELLDRALKIQRNNLIGEQIQQLRQSNKEDTINVTGEDVGENRVSLSSDDQKTDGSGGGESV